MGATLDPSRSCQEESLLLIFLESGEDRVLLAVVQAAPACQQLLQPWKALEGQRDAEAPLQRRGGPGADTSVNPRPCLARFLPGDLGWGSLSPGHLPGTADFSAECGTKHLVQRFLLLLLKRVWILFLSH